MPQPLLRNIDPSKLDQIQSGYIGGDPRKPDPPKEELSPKLEIERKVYQQIMKDLIPEFPVKKLEKQSLADVRAFFAEISPLIKDEILERYHNISP